MCCGNAWEEGGKWGDEGEFFWVKERRISEHLVLAWVVALFWFVAMVVCFRQPWSHHGAWRLHPMCHLAPLPSISPCPAPGACHAFHVLMGKGSVPVFSKEHLVYHRIIYIFFTLKCLNSPYF